MPNKSKELDSGAGMLNDGMDAGKEYKTFTRLPKGVDGNMKFIIKTDELNLIL